MAVNNAIKKYYVNNPRAGYPFDHRKKKYFSYGFDFWAGGRRYQERGFLTQAEAESVIQAIRAKAKAGKYGIVATIEQPYLIELFQKKLDTMQGPDRVRAKRVFKDFLELLPKKLRVTDIRSSHFRLYVEKRQSENVSAATIRRELVPAVAALNSADTFFDSLEGYRPPKIPRPKISKTRKSKTISFDESKAILTWLLDPKNDNGRGLYRRTALFLAMCLGTASRPGEIAKLTKSDVDLNSMTLRIRGTKTEFVSTAGERMLTIGPNAEKILRERIEKTRTEFLFTRGGKVTGKMYAALKAACEANGFIYGRESFDGIVFHRSRHTGITNMLNDGVALQIAGAVAGQADQTMTMYYAHPNREAMKEAVIELDSRIAIG